MSHTWCVTPCPAGAWVSATVTDDDTGQWATVAMSADKAEELGQMFIQKAQEARELAAK